jgi:hypothetical protein
MRETRLVTNELERLPQTFAIRWPKPQTISTWIPICSLKEWSKGVHGFSQWKTNRHELEEAYWLFIEQPQSAAVQPHVAWKLPSLIQSYLRVPT